MKNKLLKQSTTNLAVVALVGLLGACATTASPRAENVLLSAGFKAKVATTAKQRQELQTLPEGKVSPVRQKGKTFYVYPDAPHNQIYVGNKAQYQAYKHLRAQHSTRETRFFRTAEVCGEVSYYQRPFHRYWSAEWRDARMV